MLDGRRRLRGAVDRRGRERRAPADRDVSGGDAASGRAERSPRSPPAERAGSADERAGRSGRASERPDAAAPRRERPAGAVGGPRGCSRSRGDTGCRAGTRCSSRRRPTSSTTRVVLFGCRPMRTCRTRSASPSNRIVRSTSSADARVDGRSTNTRGGVRPAARRETRPRDRARSSRARHRRSTVRRMSLIVARPGRAATDALQAVEPTGAGTGRGGCGAGARSRCDAGRGAGDGRRQALPRPGPAAAAPASRTCWPGTARRAPAAAGHPRRVRARRRNARRHRATAAPRTTAHRRCSRWRGSAGRWPRSRRPRCEPLSAPTTCDGSASAVRTAFSFAIASAYSVSTDAPAPGRRSSTAAASRASMRSTPVHASRSLRRAQRQLAAS